MRNKYFTASDDPHSLQMFSTYNEKLKISLYEVSLLMSHFSWG